MYHIWGTNQDSIGSSSGFGARQCDKIDTRTSQTGTRQRVMAISKKRLKDIEAIRDEDIDYSDIPELDKSFWANAELVDPDTTQHVTLRIKRDQSHRPK